MNNQRSYRIATSTSLLSAIAASLCCITPVIALVAGSSSIASTFSWIEPARPYLIGFSIAILLNAWYQKLKPAPQNDDCVCEPNKNASFLRSKAFLGIVTVFAILMMTFPLYAQVFYPKQVQTTATSMEDQKQVTFSIEGMTCAACENHINQELSKLNGILSYNTSYTTKSSFVSYNPSKVDLPKIEAVIDKAGYKVKKYTFMENSNSINGDITFYEAPLVCEAAPSIGCGSKAKFMLADFEKHHAAVEGAWLNRKGTFIAIQWKQNVSPDKKTSILKTVTSAHAIPLKEVHESANISESKSFPTGWYKSTAVDDLSKEEAGIIAQNTIDEYKQMGLIKEVFENKFKADIEQIYADLFLSISSYQELTQVKYGEIEDKIQKAGERYVGKGKMPKVELCTFGKESCEKDKSCSETDKSCCEKN